MKKKIIYYINLLLTLLLVLAKNYYTYDIYRIESNEVSFLNKILFFRSNIIIIIITLILLITLFVLKIKKYKFDKVNPLLSYSYSIFLVIFIPILFIYNNYVLIDYIHFNYYTNIILILFDLLNIYYLLSAKRS